MPALMSRQAYRDIFVWSLEMSEGMTHEEAEKVFDSACVLEQCIEDIQRKEDARLLAILDSLCPK